MRRRRALIVLILLAVIVSWEVWFFAPCSNTGTEHCGEEWVVLAGLRWSMHLFNEVGQWLQSLHGGAPPFLGALTGSLLGLLGILVGALFNANLNRKRDDRLRQQEALLVIVALRVELVGLRDSLINNAERLEQGASTRSDVFVPDIAHSVKLFPELISKLGLVGEDAIAAVVKAFLLIEQYGTRLFLMNATIVENSPSGRQIFGILGGPGMNTAAVARLNRVTANEIDDAIKKLNCSAKDLKVT